MEYHFFKFSLIQLCQQRINWLLQGSRRVCKIENNFCCITYLTFIISWFNSNKRPFNNLILSLLVLLCATAGIWSHKRTECGSCGGRIRIKLWLWQITALPRIIGGEISTIIYTVRQLRVLAFIKLLLSSVLWPTLIYDESSLGSFHKVMIQITINFRKVKKLLLTS